MIGDSHVQKNSNEKKIFSSPEKKTWLRILAKDLYVKYIVRMSDLRLPCIVNRQIYKSSIPSERCCFKTSFRHLGTVNKYRKPRRTSNISRYENNRRYLLAGSCQHVAANVGHFLFTYRYLDIVMMLVSFKLLKWWGTSSVYIFIQRPSSVGYRVRWKI